MKKKIASLVLLVLALTVMLTACTQTDKTKIIPRWSTEGETYVYNVTLADFNTAANATTRFISYHNPDDNLDYHKDFVVRAGEPLDDKDEVRPIEVEGTFEITITSREVDSVAYDTVTTRQYLKVTYNLENGKIVLGDNLLATAEAMEKLSGRVVATTSETITLESTTETSVEFRHDDKQAPQKSGTTVHGFYVGKTNQETSDYEISTTYNYEGKNTVVTTELTTNGKTNTITDTLKKRYTEDTFIDSNQLLMYTRSFDKTSGSFQDSPSVVVYNPLTQSMQTANFIFTASANAVLTNGAEQLFVKLPTVGVMIDGRPFMLQESAPNLIEAKADRTMYTDTHSAKHTPVRFRVGYMSFELDYEVGSCATPQKGESVRLWDALTAYVKGDSTTEE